MGLQLGTVRSLYKIRTYLPDKKYITIQHAVIINVIKKSCDRDLVKGAKLDVTGEWKAEW